MAAKKTSILQDQATALRELCESITEYEAIEKTLQADVDQCELELMKARSNLHDTQTLLYAQRDKRYRDANNMHELIAKAVGGNRTMACEAKQHF